MANGASLLMRMPSWLTPREVGWTDSIVVPFAPETKASGVNNTGFYKAAWYSTERNAPALKNGERLILHFGAVDFAASVWVNEHLVVQHEGGYTSFSADITDALRVESGSTNFVACITLRAFDNPHDLEKNRGKQDWLRDAHGIWYPRTTGIWQTVWWEVVPAVHIDYLSWSPSLKDWSVSIEAELKGSSHSALVLDIELSCGGRVLAREMHNLTESELRVGRILRTLCLHEVLQRLELPDNQMPDLRNWLIWSPERPNLIEAKVRLRTDEGIMLDAVESYTALRSFERRGRELLLNDEPISRRLRSEHGPGMLRLALDQGYWRESGMTPPDDRAIERDVLIAKSLFHGVRKHNKIEDPRFLYWADVHGLLVWQELPSAYLFSPLSMQRSINLWQEAIRRDKSHPCIIAWVPINESWQVPRLAQKSALGELQRQFVSSMYYLTKALTNGAVVVGNDGWGNDRHRHSCYPRLSLGSRGVYVGDMLTTKRRSRL